MKKRVLPLLMALTIGMGLFAGCGSSELQPYTEPEVSSEVTAAEQNMVKDYTPVFETYAPDMVMLTVNGSDVTWQEIFYWMHYNVTSIEYYYGEIADWNAPAPFDASFTYAEFVKTDPADVSRYYRTIESRFDEMGLTLSDEKLAEINANWEMNAESYGGEEAFIDYLNSVFMTKELFFYFEEITAKYYELLDAICGENGELLGEEEVLGLAEEKGYMRAKHILLSTVNDAGEPLGDEEKAEKLSTAETILAELQAISDPAALEAKMDELIGEYSEDPGSAAYTEGYVFLPGDMVEEFETAVTEMEPYGVSGIVETSYGYHIIMRLPLTMTVPVEFTSETEFLSLGYLMAQEIFTTMLDNWVEEYSVEYSDEYESLDVAELFSKALLVPAPMA